MAGNDAEQNTALIVLVVFIIGIAIVCGVQRAKKGEHDGPTPSPRVSVSVSHR